MSPIVYVGAAYAIVWVVLLAYAWRMNAAAKRLAEKVDKLERARGV